MSIYKFLLCLVLMVILIPKNGFALDPTWNTQIIKAKRLSQKRQFKQTHIELDKALKIAERLGENSDEYALTIYERTKTQYSQSSTLRGRAIFQHRESLKFFEGKPQYQGELVSVLSKLMIFQLGSGFEFGNNRLNRAELRALQALELIPIKKWHHLKSLYYGHLANISRLKGDFEKEEKYYLEYLKFVFQDVGSMRKFKSGMIARLGDIYRFQSKHQLAITTYREVIDLIKKEPPGQGRPTENDIETKILISKKKLSN